MSSQPFSLIVSISGQEPTRHDLSSDVVTLGRGPDNDIQVLVSEVSVKHAEFTSTPTGVVVADVGSTNGTTHHGQAVGEQPVALRSMDKLLLGATIPVYVVPSPMLDSTPIAEVIEKIEASAGDAGTAPVAVAAAVQPGPGGPVAPVRPGAVAPAAVAPGAVPPGAVTPGAPVRPGVPVAPAAPGAVAPAAQGPATIRLEQVRPNDGPARPSGGVPAGAAPGPGGPPAAPAAPAAPGVPAPAGGAPGGPVAPVAPVPLQRAGEGGVTPPSVPLPAKKKPPQ